MRRPSPGCGGVLRASLLLLFSPSLLLFFHLPPSLSRSLDLDLALIVHSRFRFNINATLDLRDRPSLTRVSTNGGWNRSHLFRSLLVYVSLLHAVGHRIPLATHWRSRSVDRSSFFPPTHTHALSQVTRRRASPARRQPVPRRLLAPRPASTAMTAASTLRRTAASYRRRPCRRRR